MKRGKFFRLTQKMREAREKVVSTGRVPRVLREKKSFDFFFLVVEKEISEGCHPCRQSVACSLFYVYFILQFSSL